MEIPKYLITDAILHIAKGNSKIGKTIYAFSTLPGNEEHMLRAKGELLTSIPGTCTKHCEACFNNCYAVNSVRLHHNACIKAWGENTLLLRSGNLEQALDEYISAQNKKKTKITLFRINVSGEIRDEKDLEIWDNVARKHPEVQFGIYTKNFEALDKFMETHGDSAPNFVINISQWHGVADEIIAKYKGKLNVFEYDDSNLKNNTFSEEDKERLKSVPKCPAVTKQGHHATSKDGTAITCDMCKRCYTKTGKATAVYAH